MCWRRAENCWECGIILNSYDALEKISFDYAVVEQETSIKVIHYSGKWKDLGTWNTLTEAMEENTIGNARLSDTCSDVHVINELDVPVLGVGLHDLVISASPEGILVADKELSSYMNRGVDASHGQVLVAAGEGSLTVKVTLNPGQSMNYHSHERRDEVWTVISGAGCTIINGMEHLIKTNDVITMAAGVRHTVIAGDSGLQLIEVQVGAEISVKDKKKYEMPGRQP